MPAGSKSCNSQSPEIDLCTVKCKYNGFTRFDVVSYCGSKPPCKLENYTTVLFDTPKSVPKPPLGSGSSISYDFNGQKIGLCFNDALSNNLSNSGPANSKVTKGNNFIVSTNLFDITVYPNPFDNELGIELDLSKTDTYDIQIFNALGQVFYKEQTLLEKGTVKLGIPVAQIPCENIIFVQVSDSNGNRIIKKATCIK
jgi:Secretion system C-terminal sorting domain